MGFLPRLDTAADEQICRKRKHHIHNRLHPDHDQIPIRESSCSSHHTPTLPSDLCYREEEHANEGSEEYGSNFQTGRLI
jgi:hypothetical protein